MVHRQFPRCRVFVWPADGSGTLVDVSADVLSFQCSKALQSGGGASPAGTFSIVLHARQRIGSNVARAEATGAYYRRFQPQSAVSIGVDRVGGIMLGLVDRVSEEIVLDGEKPVRALTLSGTDMGKLLIRDQFRRAALTSQGAVAFHEALKAELGEQSPLVGNFTGLEGLPETGNGDARVFIGQSAVDVIRYIVSKIPSMKIPALSPIFGKGAPMEFVIDTSKCVTTWEDATLGSDSGPRTYQGNYYNFIASILDEDLYEIWVDSIPFGSATFPNGQFTATREEWPAPQPVLVVRPRPFDEAIKWASVTQEPGITWETLTTLVEKQHAHTVGLDQISRASFSVDDGEAVAFYSVSNRFELVGSSGGNQIGQLFPLVDTWTHNRFGLQVYEANLTLVGDGSNRATNDAEWTADSVTSTLAPSIIEQRNRLFNWYRPLPFFEKAQLTVHGKDEYRIGDPVELPWRDPIFGGRANDNDHMRYYTAGVTHVWQDGRGYTCQLDLIRGHTRGMMEALRDRIRADSSSAAPNGFVKSDPFTDVVTE